MLSFFNAVTSGFFLLIRTKALTNTCIQIELFQREKPASFVASCALESHRDVFFSILLLIQPYIFAMFRGEPRALEQKVLGHSFGWSLRVTLGSKVVSYKLG